ncbi:MAG: LysM peptidoglycan-binding domain-containing protein [Acidobacteria bacterium]|nr:LysM peptidoglycan-binding domain-containing protein [Acidobacteriota bacterium]
MGLPELATRLRALASSGGVTLDHATLTNGTGLTLPDTYDALVRDAYGLAANESWVLSVKPNEIPDPSGNELRITAGTSTFARLKLDNSALDLRFTVDAGASALKVTAEIALADWKFTSSFPPMGGYPFDNVPYETPAFVFASEHFDSYKAAPATVVLDAGLNFASVLRIKGVLDQIRRFVSLSQDTFPFFGPIDVTASRVIPALSVRAKLAGTLVAIGPLRVASPFVELRVEYGSQTGRRSVVFVLGMWLDIGSGVAVEFTALIFEKPIEMVIGVAADPDRPMTPDALFALVGGQSWGDAVPGPLRTALQSIAFKDLEARTTIATPPAVNTLTTRVGSTKPIQLFDQFTLDEFDVIWVLQRDGDTWDSQLQFVASFKFYPELFDGEFQIGISTDLQIWGSFTGKGVSLAKLLSTITKGVVTPPSSTDFLLTDFSVALDIPRKSFALYVAGNGIFDPLGSGLLVLDSLQFSILSNASTTGRTYDASISAVLAMAGLPLGVTATYATGAGWDFLAAMPAGASVSIQNFLQRLFPGASVPSFLDHVRLSNARLAAHTGGSAPGSIDTSATIQLRDISLGPLGTYTINANFNYKHVGGNKPTTSAGFSFDTTIPGIGARVSIGYAFTSGASKVVTVTWGAFKAEYDITKSLLTFSVGEATLGGLLGQLVGLIIGDDGYRLPPPWSVLNQLSLRGLKIVYDLNAKTVSVDYSLPSPINLGFLTINGLSIQKKEKIMVALDATFVGGEKVPAFDPLDKPPDVPGGAPIDLRLLALGQRVTVPGIEKSKNIDAAIKLLASFTDTPSSGLPAGPTFSASSPWLVGLHLLVMGSTVELEIVFVDPLLYGLRIALAGDKAGPFKGLDFEILYKRITDTIGVYQIRLTLPDAMRFLQFGALAITLPIVGLDVYTNGDFKIDFGFPWNMDFSRSFGVQYFPFTGAGGFYFAKLSGATQTAIGKPSVPGTFDPVIQFGLGLQLGLGKDISAGILKAGISITVFGIVEGIIARWVPASPTDTADASDALMPAHALVAAADADPNSSHDVGKSYYYKISGTIGIIGKVYGSIDFAIIKASLNLTVTITLQAVIEAHQPLLVAFTASVDVSLSVSIDLGLFSITIHLSFKMTIRQSFTLGKATPAPWGTLGPPPPPPALLAQREAMAACVAALDFRSLAAADDDRAEIDLTFVMHPSVASNPSDATTAKGKLAAMLYLDAPDPTAPPPPLPPPNQPLPPAPTSFERFAEAVFLWVVASFGGAGEATTRRAFLETTVTRARIAAAYAYLTDTTDQRPISYDDDIVPGLYPHLKFVVKSGQTVQNAAPFPVIPELRLVAGNINRRFGDGLKVGNDYLNALRTYFEQVAARYQNDLQKKYNGGNPTPQLMTARTSAQTSYAAAIFEDVVLMLARGMTKAALEVMDAYAYPYGGRKLSDIVNDFVALGNPLTVAQLAEANKTVPFAAGVSLALTRVHYQFAADDTFAKVVSRFGVTDAAAVLSDAANATQGGVLRPDVQFTSGVLSYKTQPGDTFARIVTGETGWSYTTLADALKTAPDAILPLSLLVLPTVSYTTADKDTLTGVANSFGLDPLDVAAAAADVPKLYADPDGKLELSVPDLIALSPAMLLGRMRSKEAAANLAGANARFLLYGMRPPSPVVTGTTPPLGPPAALYELNSQQIDLPSVAQATLSIDSAQPWIEFSGGPSPLSVQLDITSAKSLAGQFAAVVTAQGVPAHVDSITPLPTFHDDPRRYTLRRTAVVQAAEPIIYPFDGGTSSAAATPRLWFVPDAMARSLAEPKQLLPAFTLEATSAGNPPEKTAPRRYGWATVVDVEIKRHNSLPDTYEVFGSDEAGTALLEALVTPGSQANISGIELLTGANATGQVPTGYTDAGLSKVRAYLVKTNLSTETNPRAARGALVAQAQPKLTGILNDPLDFLRLLWEASVTRSGGFSLTYRRDDGTGLPETIFAQGESATVTFMILHAADGDVVHRGANAVLVGDGFDPARYNLAAVSAAQQVNYVAQGTESLDDIVAAYRIPVTSLGVAAAQARLSPAAMLKVSGIVHQVQGPTKGNPATETLTQIAQAYGVTAQQIIDLNPGVSFNPLFARTLLRIPDISRTGAQHASLSALSDAFGVGTGALALTNRAVPKIFAASTVNAPNTFTFDDQLVDRIPTLPPGNVGFVLTRANPGSGGDPATTLAAQFNLLGFSVAENVAFNPTTDALPVGPTRETGVATRAALHAFAAAPDWKYTQALYVAAAAKGAKAGDPYAGAGSYVQIAFDLRDMFGNLAASAITESALAPPQPQNDAPLCVAYTDALLGPGSWPSVGVDYRFYRREDTGRRVLSLAFTFDASRYTPDSPPSPSHDPNDVPAWQQRALADQVAFHTIARQLSAPGVSLYVSTTMDGGAAHGLDTAAFAAFASAAADYLGALAAGTMPPLPVVPQAEFEVAPANPADLFALEVSIVVARPASQVDVAFIGTNAERISMLVSPRAAAKAGAETQALAAFAQDLEAAYVDGDVFLKVAGGRSQRDAADAPAVWIVRLRTKLGSSADAGIGFAVTGPARYYAPRPLSNVLISRGDVPILKYDPQTGIDWNNSKETAFSGIAMDTWGRTALAALDRFLSPDFAGAAFLIDHVDPEKNGYLQKLLKVKADLAADISQTLEPILQIPPLDPEDSAPFNDASETMRQQILAKTENAYIVSAVCQFRADVSSKYINDPDKNLYAPRFYGSIGATLNPAAAATPDSRPWSFTVARPVLAPKSAFVTTALTVVDPTAQSHLPLDLNFKLSNIEYDISKGVDGEYLASSWLAFVIPFDREQPGAPRVDTRIGAADIPVVLRAIPPAPSLVAQDAVPTPDDGDDQVKAFEDAKRWSYAFTYEKDVVAQDTIDCSVTFNLDDTSPIGALAARPLDLFDYLARFVSVWPEMLQTMIEVLVPEKLNLDPASDAYKRARTLVGDFYKLLEPMPAAWALWHARSQRKRVLAALFAAPQVSEFAFSVQEQDVDGLLIARRTLGKSTAKVWDPAAKQFIPLPPPQLTIDDGATVWTSTPYDSQDSELFKFTSDGETLTYEAAEKLRQRRPIFRGLADGLDIAAYQNGWSAVQVFRNRDLVRDAEGQIIPTTPDFIYSTPEIRFASRITPMLLRTRVFDVAALSSPPLQTLATHIQRVLSLLFEGTVPGTEQFVRLDGEYAQTIGDGLPPAVTPIFLGVPTRITLDGAATLAENAADYVVSWFANYPADGSFRFALTLFPTLSSSRLPLLQITQLMLARKNVSGLPDQPRGGATEPPAESGGGRRTKKQSSPRPKKSPAARSERSPQPEKQPAARSKKQRSTRRKVKPADE